MYILFQKLHCMHSFLDFFAILSMINLIYIFFLCIYGVQNQKPISYHFHFFCLKYKNLIFHIPIWSKKYLITNQKSLSKRWSVDLFKSASETSCSVDISHVLTTFYYVTYVCVSGDFNFSSGCIL